MTYVGAFATSDLGPELLVVVSIHRPPRDSVKLCRLSDGHCFSLSPSRVHILDRGWRLFEDHMAEEVSKFRLAHHKGRITPTPSACQIESAIEEYISIIDETSASYRLMPLKTYIIQKEFDRWNFPSYTKVDCWRHVRHACELKGLAPPTLKVVRSRLEGIAKQDESKHKFRHCV